MEQVREALKKLNVFTCIPVSFLHPLRCFPRDIEVRSLAEYAEGEYVQLVAALSPDCVRCGALSQAAGCN
jgi:hypothetical protein